MSITKETIISQLQNKSNEISLAFDIKYKDEISDISNELSYVFNILSTVINREDQSIVSDQDFQSACLFWTGLNTILAGVELFRRGYNKEPQMLLRNALEIFATGYDIHKNLNRYQELTNNPNKFSSTDSIKVAKEIHPVIGNFYGLLSDRFAHVSVMHILPHNSDTPLAVGGIFDPKNQETIVLGMTTFTLTFEVLSSILELAMFKYVENPKFWKLVNGDTCEYTPNKERMSDLSNKIKETISLMKD